jgi:hypothetical protein
MTWIIQKQLWGHKDADKLHLGSTRTKKDEYHWVRRSLSFYPREKSFWNPRWMSRKLFFTPAGNRNAVPRLPSLWFIVSTQTALSRRTLAPGSENNNALRVRSFVSDRGVLHYKMVKLSLPSGSSSQRYWREGGYNVPLILTSLLVEQERSYSRNLSFTVSALRHEVRWSQNRGGYSGEEKKLLHLQGIGVLPLVP